MLRVDGRVNADIRPLRLETGVSKYAEGSCLIATGDTRVLCTATVQDKVPGWRSGANEGWVTAEYAMLPRAGKERNVRESVAGRPGGRSQEIQRLIGRALRLVTDLAALGERTVIVDCDVLQADGGTRTASINGGYVALAQACRLLLRERVLKHDPLRDQVGAIAIGIVSGEVLVDLCYEEDSRAGTDLNVVLTGRGGLVEVQGTAETVAFTRQQLEAMLDLATKATQSIFAAQREVLAALDAGS